MKKIFISEDKLYNAYITNNESIQEICKTFNCSRQTIYNYLTEFKIKKRPSCKSFGKHGQLKYSKNESYFSKPNLENCYWAGFIAADGCIRNRGESRQLVFCINQKDSEILYQFAKNTNYTGIIKNRTYNRKPNTGFKQDKYYSSTLQISNACNWCKKLSIYWNITSSKSLTLQPPNLTELEHKLAYIIGYIDGDGHIGIYLQKHHKQKHLELKIVGTKDILIWISDVLYTIENKQEYQKSKLVKNNNIYVLKYSRRRAYNLLKQLEKIQTPYRLSRKWDKIKEYENINNII